MAKTLRKILISLFGALAMMFAGILFAACDVDYSKIQLVADKEVVEMEVGDDGVDITFTIEGYQSGFSNKIQSNAGANANAAVFSVSQPRYLSDSQFVVTVTAVSGGVGHLSIKTLEGGKECSVEIRVKQYSKTLSVNDNLLYVSNSTKFVPSQNMFTFDANTTEKGLSHYFVSDGDEINFSSYHLKEIVEEESRLFGVFTDGTETSVDVKTEIFAFDSARLDETNQLVLSLGQADNIVGQTNKFFMLSVYDHSIENENYERILSTVGTVHVLPDLKVGLTGGYLLPDNKIYHLDEKGQLQEGFGEISEEIQIVPNNNDLVQFILRLEMIEISKDSDIIVKTKKSNEDVIVDFFDYVGDEENEEDNFQYIKISQNTLKQSSTTLDLDIYYAFAQQIENDESVNCTETIEIKTEIAPTAITVNGKTEADALKLYYYHVSPLYGWEDLNIDVISNFETSPSFKGIYFTFDSDFLDVMHDGLTVLSGTSRLYTAQDLNTPFRVRAIGQQAGEKQIKIHVVSDIAAQNTQNFENGEITCTIDCSIVEGARWLRLDDSYASTLYMDLDGGQVGFSNHIFAKADFKAVTVRHINGADVAEFFTNNGGAYKFDEETERYYLNLSATPKMAGTGRYEFMLDNGTAIDVTFSVIRSLKAESTFVQMTTDENNSYTFSSLGRTAGALFDNVLNFEIQNDSTAGEVSYGKTARFEILSNGTIDNPVLDSDLFVSISRNQNVFAVTTRGNGDTQITINLTGYVVDDFTLQDRMLTVFVNVSSYSLVDEFFLKNGDNFALHNTIYYGYSGASEESTSVTFTASANNVLSNNFNQYQLTGETLKTLFETANETEDDLGQTKYNFNIINENFAQIITQKLVHEAYDKKFVYFYAIDDETGKTLDRTETEVVVTKAFNDASGRPTTETKPITLRINSGLMFYADNGARDLVVYEERNEYGDLLATYSIRFSNVFSIVGYGQFDMNTFTFNYSLDIDRPHEIVFSAYISQRNLTKRYDAHIYPTLYIPVESISLLSSMNEVNFSNQKLTAVIGVSLYPNVSTSKDIRLEFLTTQGNPYYNMLTWEVDSSKKDSGLYTITLSCERFFKENDVVSLKGFLTGLLYIYPSEWGTTYTEISPDLQPIRLDVQYRNGSKENPYILETADDVLAINANETTLKSHYEISGVVDMSSVTNAVPIGILDGRVVGFSGSIVGTTSQSAITNVFVGTKGGKNVFRTNVGAVEYAGLFAQINAGATLENLTISGKVDLAATATTYAGILSSVNAGTLKNIGVKVAEQSQISAAASRNTYFGAVSGINHGEILQDFTKYEGTGQTSKNLAFYEERLQVHGANNANIFVGGIVGANNGRVERISASDDFKAYGYAGYSAYVNISVDGQANGVYVGGAAGVSSYYNADGTSLIPNNASANTVEISLKNLLVGGQINTLNSVATDHVGGIVGYVSSHDGIAKAYVLKNISRVFLRANAYVGGIAGFDFYQQSTGYSNVEFGNENVIQAVDDGRSSVLAAQIIRTGEVVLPEKIDEINDTEEEKLAKTRLQNVFFAIGNVNENERSYYEENQDGNKFEFSVESYLKRESQTISPETAISFESGSNNTYFGDFLLVEVKENNTVAIKGARFFPHQDVDLKLTKTEFAMTGDGDLNVYFMYFFNVSTDLAGQRGALAQDDIADLNFFTPNSKLYPFAMESQDVSMNVSSSNILSVDINGNLTVKGTGLATITLSSILNMNVSQTINLFVVNYFDKDVSSSIFYTTPSVDGTRKENGDSLILHGNSYSSVYVVPSFSLESEKTNGQFSISANGILTYKNVAYSLVKNTDITINNTPENGDYTTAQINGQMIVFHKNETAFEGAKDEYTLVPVLKVEIDGVTYLFELENSTINLKVEYKQAATAIRTTKTQHAMKTNGSFEESVEIVSTNKEEFLFYTIEGRGNVADYEQIYLPTQLNFHTFVGYKNFMQLQKDLQKDLFVLDFDFDSVQRNQNNVYNFTCKINTESEAYKNRYAQGKNIFGEYVFTFYSSELEDGVRCSFVLQLDEAALGYVGVDNYSNFNDISSPDAVAVPTQRGLLEISLDPIDAVFDSFQISNNAINNLPGAGKALFTFAYEKESAQSGVQYFTDETFGHIDANGAFTFSYEQLTKRLEELSANYKGKIYVAYIFAASGVEDEVPVAFDVNVTYGNNGEENFETTIPLQTKLDSFAKLSFDNKQQIGDAYFLARGLSYDMTLESYGFSEDQISFSIVENGKNFTSTNNSITSDYISISKVNGRYVLRVTAGVVEYGEVGAKVEITTHAKKTVDNIPVETEHTLEIYIMDYVMNYQYVEGVNEDIVRGMNDGVISTAIGNPYRLEFAIRDFLEFDPSIDGVSRSVDAFVAEMTQNLDWIVYENGQEAALEQGKDISSAGGYYQISSFTVTPIQLYHPSQNIYHFSVGGLYQMRNGRYEHAAISSQNTNVLYSEFAFSVHEQSTQDSPIPIRTYEDLLAMNEDQWYILLDNIDLPNATQTQQFMPISTRIAGLDGNGWSIRYGGAYNFDGLSSVGLFSTVAEDTILKNIKIQLSSSVTIRLNVETFNLGLLAATNEGVVTNCSVEAVGDLTTLSVEDIVTANSSYVAALVAQNTGFITNSRSKINMISNVNLSGFVGTNSGHIASSYFRGGYLKNDTNTTSEFTAGFAIRNSGQIYTSYVSGEQTGDEEEMYYSGEDDFIQASGNLAGFVYTNDGQIYDSYSNIRMNGLSGRLVAGFAFENTGRIERSFSTSVLKSNDDSNYGFVYSNNVTNDGEELEDGIFKCYYLSDPTDNVNVDIGKIIITDPQTTELEDLSADEFKYFNADGSVNDKFKDFVVQKGREINSVWFYNDDPNSKKNFEENSRAKSFNTGRIELVSANIIATSHRLFDHAENVVDAATGASYVRYVYVYDANSAALGTKYNPILISNAEEFENYILQENNSSNQNNAYYRLISDVDYSEYLYNSQTYKTVFRGYFEGNFMSVSGQILLSSERMTFAGLFAQVDGSLLSNEAGTVMNFTYSPDVVDFANTNIVGAIAGRTDGGRILNVSLEGEGTVNGNNIVGGAVGMTLGDFKMQNVSSEFSAKARNQETGGGNDFDANSYTNFIENYSIAGSVVGVASGKGMIYNSVTKSVVSAIAGKAGLMFGFVDEEVTVEKVELHILSDMMVNGYSYAGLVVGESKGNFKKVKIFSDGSVEGFTNFRQVPFVPSAIGGFAGLISGGTLDDITMGQSIVVSTESSSNGIVNVGGIAGEISDVRKVSNIKVQNVALTGYSYVGGVAGSVTANGIVNFENITVDNVTLNALGASQSVVGVGGLAGFVDSSTIISLTKNEEISDEKVDSNIFNITANAMVYSYGAQTPISGISIGAIVGSNAAGSGHQIFDTNSSINADVRVQDLSKNFGDFSGNVSVVSTDGKISLVPSVANIFECRENFATRSNYFCNITYTVSKNESMLPVCVLNVNLYGTATLAN